MLPNVFDLLARIDHPRGRQGGLGLGLTLVKRLVEMHGGQVEAKSLEPDQGSEFFVHLPLAHAQPLDRSPESQKEESPPIPSGKVLVVDDNRDAADSLGILLRCLGIEVHVAHDAPSALEAMRIFSPAIVLLDLGMPGMDGYELARRIRQQRKFKDVLLIALTGWGQPEDRRRTMEAGIDHHLVKPVEIDALQSLLASAGVFGNRAK
jgi:CheY-like chemotaxis protein